jgi:hypothetical protein
MPELHYLLKQTLTLKIGEKLEYRQNDLALYVTLHDSHVTPSFMTVEAYDYRNGRTKQLFYETDSPGHYMPEVDLPIITGFLKAALIAIELAAKVA